MKGRVTPGSTALRGGRVRSVSASRHRGTRVVRQVGAALTAGALSLFSGGIIGHALSASTTTLTSGTNPSVWGQSIVFTATITPVAPAPTGTVTFQDSGTNIAGCVNRPVAARVANCTTAALAVGSHTVTAVYGGNATYATSTSAPVTQVVSMGSTTTVVAASGNPSVSGQTVTYTATVSALAPASGTRTGTVAFQDGGIGIAGCAANAVAVAGTATCAIAYAGPGAHTIIAIYSGDANFTASTASALTQTVNLGATAVALSSSVNPTSTGANITFTANVTATASASGLRTGTVDFQVGGVNIAGCSAQVVPASGKATCVTNTLTVGANTVTALYSGDANFAASASAAFAQTVNQGATTTKVVSSLNPSSNGVMVTFTATVTAVAPASGTRTGTVAFDDGGIAIAGCAAQTLGAAGTTTCATNALAAGVHTITAVYGGDGNFTTSTSPALTQTVLSTTTTIVTSSANPSVFGQSIQYTATVAGGPTATGTITFRDGGANIAGCVAVVMAAGSASCTVSPTVASHAITAIYSGDASNAASTSPVMTQVVTADPTTTVVTATVNPTVFGQSVTFTAAVTANAPGSGTPTGKVAFDNGAVAIAGCGGVTLVAGVASCTTNALALGGHSISGHYTGSANDVISTSPVLTETVNLGSTATVVGSSLNPSVSGQSVTYTATVTVVAPAAGIPTGTVNFEDGGVTVAGCVAKGLTAAGTAGCSFTYPGAATHSITAIYSGGLDFAGSTSPTLTQAVNQASTSTALASSVNPSVAGQAVTITASVSVIAPGSGMRTATVMFEDGGITITGCAAQAVSAAGSAVCATSFTAAGAHPITAVYSGDANFSGSTSPILDETVNQGATATAVISSVDPSLSGQTVVYTAIVTATAPAAGTPTGTVTFMDGATTISGCIAQAMVGGVATCTSGYAGVGGHAITAVYSGDPNFTSSTSPILTQTVNQGSTSALVTSSADPSVSGQAVTYTATVTALAPASGTPSGTATFMDGATTLGGCIGQPLIGGVAACGVAYTGIGGHAITAVYSGDLNFTGSTSPILTQTVSPASTSTSLASSVNPSVTGQSVTATATVSVAAPGSGLPTGTVAFLDDGTTVAGCAAQAVTGAGVATCDDAFVAAGAESITAVYSGDADFSSSTGAALTQTINQGATSTVGTSSVNPSVSGESVSYTGTVSAVAPASGTPTGTANFLDGASDITGCDAQPLVGGVASCNVVYAGAGSHSITVIYSGDPNFIGSTSSVVAQTVSPAATSTSLASSVNPSVTGQPVTITATLSVNAPGSGTPTGTVSFQNDGTTIAGCAANPVSGIGIATCADTFVAAGAEAVTAIYSGDTNFISSTSPILTQTINQGATAIVVTSSVDPSVAGESVSYTSVVTAGVPASGSPTGSVAFLDGASTIPGCGAQPLVAGTASCNMTYAGVGAQAIAAVYSGDPNFTPSTSPILTQTVNPGATSTLLTSSADPTVTGQSVTYTAAVTALAPASGIPTGTATFMDGATTISGCLVQPLIGGVAACSLVYAGIGTHAITAIYNGDPNFTPSTSQLLTQTINPATTATSLASSLNPSVTGQPVTITATVNVTAPGAGSPTGTVAFLDGGVPIAECAAQAVAGGTATCATSFDTAGASAITAAYSGDSNFTSSTSSVFTQTINQGATAAVVVSSASPSVAGDGVSFTATVSAVAPASGTPTGTVAFLDGASTIPGCATQALIAGMASCSVTYAVGGSHAITGVYSGDPNFAAATSAPLNQHVVLAVSATTVTSPASIWVAGQPGTFEATVVPVGPAHVTPTGTAAFMDAGAPILGCAAQPVVSGDASCSVVFTRIGTDPITAVYSGDGALTGSTSPTLMLSVYDDPPTPDAGANSTPSRSLAYGAILGGVFLVFLVGCARLRRRDVDRD
jgi:large repetitive protein